MKLNHYTLRPKVYRSPFVCGDVEILEKPFCLSLSCEGKTDHVILEKEIPSRIFVFDRSKKNLT